MRWYKRQIKIYEEGVYLGRIWKYFQAADTDEVIIALEKVGAIPADRVARIELELYSDETCRLN